MQRCVNDRTSLMPNFDSKVSTDTATAMTTRKVSDTVYIMNFSRFNAVN